MSRNTVVVAAVGAALAVMLWAGIRKSRPGGLVGGKVSVTEGGALSKGKPAPEFELVDLNTGNTVHLADYKGKAVLLNFWATWCGPCKVEIPWFVDLQKQYGPQGLEILGVAMDDGGRDKILEFSHDMHVNYTVLQGTDKVGDAYNVSGFPTTYYIGRDGTIVTAAYGLASHKEVEDNVRSALNTHDAAVSAQAAR